MGIDFNALSAPFPPEAVHWRAQLVTERNGSFSALALAYIDARDVQDRLDEVCGPENWSNAFVETATGRVVCTLSLNVDGHWIAKSDGAGNTDVEAEKGGLSDALKRSAVMWGIGRYLYRLADVWAECEPMRDREGNVLKNNKGKPQFKKWTTNGLRDLAKAVGGSPPAQPKPAELTRQQLDAIAKLDEADTLARLKVWSDDNKALIDAAPEAVKRTMRASYSSRKKAIEAMDAAAA